MKYIKQFSIILFISLLGEILHLFIPLPIPASIYGLILMLGGLKTGIVPLASVKETSKFLIEIMPIMFIPAAVELLNSWELLKPILIPFTVITLVSTVIVMAATGNVTQHFIQSDKKEKGEKPMNSAVKDFLFFGAVISILAYQFGLFLKSKLRLAIFNPLLISIIAVMIFLSVFHIDYENYHVSAKYISYLLTPATVCLAVPLYEQLSLLKKHSKAILAGTLTGVLTTMVTILILAIVFHLDHTQYVTFLPKSITTAIGMGISEELGGFVTITVACIIITGIIGNMIAEAVLKIFKITDPVAKGIAIGSASHAIGTTKAMEIGEIEGAMSSLAIATSGLCTVLFASVFAGIY